jgi:hypothetical protein
MKEETNTPRDSLLPLSSSSSPCCCKNQVERAKCALKNLSTPPAKKQTLNFSLSPLSLSFLKNLPCKRVTFHCDVGYGNRLFIRGEGTGLSWKKGIPVKNVAPDRWVWEAIDEDGAEFKALINDECWEQGANHRIYGTELMDIHPTF